MTFVLITNWLHCQEQTAREILANVITLVPPVRDRLLAVKRRAGDRASICNQSCRMKAFETIRGVRRSSCRGIIIALKP